MLIVRETNPLEPLEPSDSGRFSGRKAFEQLVREALARAAQEGWREIILSDACFVDWPLRERSVLESLQAWSRSGRQLTMLAIRFDNVLRDHARFVAWRKTWGHLIVCRQSREVSAGDLPSAILGPDWFVHRQDPVRSRGTFGQDRMSWGRLKDMLDARIFESAPGFPASTLGL